MDHAQGDPSRLRISDADRDQVAEVLRDAAAEGRIDLEELDERLEATYAAKVYADLVPITLDLPGPGLAAPVVRPTRPVVGVAGPGGLPIPVHTSALAVMSAVERRGVWRVPEQVTAFALMGSVVIDLRQAVFTARETVIYANTVLGGVDIYVNAGTVVVIEGHGLIGAFDQARDRVPAEYDGNAPVVRVKGLALMGAVTVTRKRMPGEKRPLKRLPKD